MGRESLLDMSGDTMRRFLACCAILLPVCSAGATGEPQQQQLTITIYNNDLALVQDVRRLDVPAGRTRLEFKNVSADIKPETVSLSGHGLSTVEQNFDYDLLTPAKMMEKAVGKQIQIVRTNPGNGGQVTETATVLSVNDGVILKVGNRIEVLRDDGIPTRVLFSSIPENLRAEPTLSVTVDAAQAGPRDATLSYLTNGLSWKADYVALFDEKQGTMHLQGWITMRNGSGTSFQDAKAELVAGDVATTANGVNDNGGWRPERPTRTEAGTGGANQASVADYYIYSLPEKVTIANAQTKQIGFVDIADVRASKAYQFRFDDYSSDTEPQHAGVVLKFDNAKTALPAGTVRVYMRDAAGEPKFVGEDDVDHTPAGSTLGIKIGDAFDVTVQRTVKTSEKIASWRTRYTMSYLLRNALDKPVDVDITQAGLWRDGDVEDESIKSKRIDATTLGWTVPVPANGETTLTATIDSGD
jgi:hypothetical protein